ncbi:hypothetical protein [Ruminococcus flavefaciens]|uniref:hypothetical protein n=1 Tax=Ruminococcus flavefaciens TaxID=1265 RepID=UPI0026ED5B00|nr:hypothetical protein [Ruminococcus flavefaciens]MDD7517076.1 hypothetical protein [Ruminococcus flavefaciens]MDY5692070.1 hypothetical protein [Ruminococcus flavefaciens]
MMTEQMNLPSEEITEEELATAKELRRQEIEKAFSSYKFLVVRKELFAHLRDPAVVIRNGNITFNTACINGLEDVVYVQLLLCEDEKMFAVKGCQENDKDALRWCIAKPDKRKSRKMTCPDFTKQLYDMMGWDPKCRYKILGYKIEFDGETYYAFDLVVTETFREKPKKGEVVTEPVDTRKGYYSDDIAGTFGVPVEEHKKRTQIAFERGYNTVAMLTDDKKPEESEEGEQLTLETDSASAETIDATDAPVTPAPIMPEQSADAQPTGEVRPDEEKLNKPEVSDGTDSMESK